MRRCPFSFVPVGRLGLQCEAALREHYFCRGFDSQNRKAFLKCYRSRWVGGVRLNSGAKAFGVWEPLQYSAARVVSVAASRQVSPNRSDRVPTAGDTEAFTSPPPVTQRAIGSFCSC